MVHVYMCPLVYMLVVNACAYSVVTVADIGWVSFQQKEAWSCVTKCVPLHFAGTQKYV